MPIFRRPMWTGDCDRCGRPFDPAYGGICALCREALCSTDLHGRSIFSKLRGWLFAKQTICVRCRTEGPPATVASTS